MAKSLNGVRLPHHKTTESSATKKLPIPSSVSIVMSQHIGTPCQPTVKIGDTVTVGQVIGDSEELCSSPIHASVSGTVAKIEKVTMPNGLKTDSIIIESDGKQTFDETLAPPLLTDHDSFIAAIRASGLVGLGGAGFPTHIKFNPPNLSEVKTLLINGAECEPYITSDYLTMMEQPEDLLYGLSTILEQTGIAKCIIAIEDNKPLAIEKMKSITASNPRVEVCILPSEYPQGAEKVLIHQAMDGLVLPEGKFPPDIGVIVSNVTTIAELGVFFKYGIPLTNKRVTVDGSAISTPSNVMVPIGTSVEDLIAFCGGYKEPPAKVILGGPMMGLTIMNEHFPILKNNNAIIAFTRSEATRYAETSCIRCGECVRACPIDLMPYRLKSATTNTDIDSLSAFKVNLCIECGCCSYVCPAKIELVQAFRKGKVLLKNAGK